MILKRNISLSFFMIMTVLSQLSAEGSDERQTTLVAQEQISHKKVTVAKIFKIILATCTTKYISLSLRA